MNDEECRLILLLEDIAGQYADDHKYESSGQWSDEGIPYQDIRFTMNGKKYVIMFGETNE